MSKNFPDKFNKFLTKRVIILFIVFFIINIMASLPVLNHFSEIVSHFKLHYFYTGIIFAAVFIYLSVFNKKFITGVLISLLLIILNFSDIAPYFMQPKIKPDGNTIKLALYNVLTRNIHYNLLLDEIKKENPDIIILQEVDDNWLNAVSEIKQNYPFFIEHERDDNFGIAMYSKFPYKDARIEEWSEYNLPVAAAKIIKDNKEIQIYAVHTLPPLKKDYFLIRNEMFKQINQIIKSNSENLIIAGDFNSTSFSYAYKKYIKSTKINDAQTLTGNIREGSWNTYHFPILRITVEHVLSTKDITPVSYKQGNFFGSDHFPVFVELALN